MRRFRSDLNDDVNFYIPFIGRRNASYGERAIDQSSSKLYQFFAVLRRVTRIVPSMCHHRTRTALVGRLYRSREQVSRVTLVDLSHFRNYRWTARLILVITRDIPAADYSCFANIVYRLLLRCRTKFLSVLCADLLLGCASNRKNKPGTELNEPRSFISRRVRPRSREI